MRRTRIYTVHVPCFPSYVMVQLDLARDALHPVITCEGVKRMFMASGQPVPFPRGEVEKLMADADGRRNLEALAEGSRVRVHAGPFYDREGVCLWSAADRVALLMEAFDGLRRVVVPRASVVLV